MKPERQAEYDDGIGAGPEGWEHTMLQDGREVYKFATHALAKAATMAAEKIGFDLNELDKIVPHQANIRIIETAAYGKSHHQHRISRQHFQCFDPHCL